MCMHVFVNEKEWNGYITVEQEQYEYLPMGMSFFKNVNCLNFRWKKREN